jgi:signal transduction histidine kinase
MTQKVLLVDDEEGIRKVLTISLADSGYDVTACSSGEEALTRFREIKPCIVMTDIKMPGMDGIELLKRIKAEDPDTEVIMITGHGEMDLAIQSLKFDATDFITKPIHDDVLLIALKRANERIELKTKLKAYTENLERLVEEKSRQLLESERLAAVGQTVAGLAHAVKNITGGLTGGMFVLEKGMELRNEKYLKEGWEMVKGNVGRIKSVALDLLNYAKEREPGWAFCEPNQPAREVYDLMLPRARELGVILELNLDDGLPKVWLDPEGIHRCLLNLVTNGIDACVGMDCPVKEGQVTVKSSKEEGWAVVYRVIDNGCGMDEETQSKIFKRFFSTKGSRGTGLGLMIAKKIVDEHDGLIALQSEKSKGTEFTIRLPAREKEGFELE